MALRTYAYRVGREVALLNEEEWSQIAPLLNDRIKWIKEHRKATGCSIEEARQFEPVGQSALRKYQELTGIALEHPDQLWGVRMNDYGSLCPKCEKPFRTPRAKLCAVCGFQLPAGRVAGQLSE